MSSLRDDALLIGGAVFVGALLTALGSILLLHWLFGEDFLP